MVEKDLERLEYLIQRDILALRILINRMTVPTPPRERRWSYLHSMVRIRKGQRKIVRRLLKGEEVHVREWPVW